MSKCVYRLCWKKLCVFSELSYMTRVFLYLSWISSELSQRKFILNVTPGRHLLSLVETHDRSRRRNKNYHHHMWLLPRNGLSREHFFALLFLLLRWGRFYCRPFHNTLFPVYDAISTFQLFFHTDVYRFSNLLAFRH